MTYRGKVDWWIGLAILAAVIVPIPMALATGRYWLVIQPVFLTLFLLGCCYPQKFETTGSALVIRAGLITRRIPYPEIAGVRPTSDARSSLAMSLDRIVVEYKGTSIMIAPDKQEQFLEDIAAHAPQLSKRGQGLAISFR